MATDASANEITVQKDASGIDFLKNSDASVKLSAFDGALAAVVEFNGKPFLITTHARYIPAPPHTIEHDIFLRKDARYGADDFTQWPQQWSDTYCHLSVRSRETVGELAALWWDPTPEDFQIPAATATAVLGRLSSLRFKQLKLAVDSVHLSYKEFIAEASGRKLPSIMDEAVVSMRLALDRVQSVSCAYEDMVLAVRKVQRTALELDALVEYMRIYHPRMIKCQDMSAATRAAPLMGAYTGQPEVAQRLYLAGIPYWYVRDAGTFDQENILELVTPLSPAFHLEQAAHPTHSSAICRTTNNTVDKHGIGPGELVYARTAS
ncbi:hypothetical protein C8R43DRAFT_1133714 [Mycena crocata]|nr:hypothetical protein C8R43DRAFT_1133714 [Mycena crocata]